MALLLVTNDDGVHAAGLAALAAALDELPDVHVIAPEREQSACGHALTLHRPLRAQRPGDRRWSVNGTPSDCVNLGVLGFLPGRPVLIVSGINHGSNLGDDVTYSGTVTERRRHNARSQTWPASPARVPLGSAVAQKWRSFPP